MEIRVRVRTLAVVGTVALALVVAGTAIGATLVKSGKSVTAVRTVTADDPARIQVSSSSATTMEAVPGMSLNVNVPAGERALLVISFSAQSHCNGTSGGWCYVRVLVDGNVAPPGDVIFDSMDDGPNSSVNSYETNSMQFVVGPTRAGSHTVTVEYGVGPYAAGAFTLTERTLTVLRSRM